MTSRRRTQSPGRRDAYPVAVPGSGTRPQTVNTKEKGDARTLRNSWAAKYFVLGATIITMHSVREAVRTTPVYVLLLTPLLLWPYVDLISGPFHITLDNAYFADGGWYGAFRAPAIGFQEHHRDPTLIYRMSAYDHVKPITSTICLNWVAAQIFHRHPLHHVYQIWLGVLLVLLQLAHRWAHMPRRMIPPAVARLQSWRLLVTPVEHLRHHHAPYEIDFAIATGWTNSILNPAVKRLPPHRTEWAVIFVLLAALPHVGFVVASILDSTQCGRDK